MVARRRKFQGVLNILSFNRHFYLIGLAGLAFLFLAQWKLAFPEVIFYAIIFAFLYGLVMPLIVSAYVYDYSGFYTFDWVRQFRIQDSAHNLFLNVNAGFDETSFLIKDTFPACNLKVFDFYNAEKHTEPAIVRARKVSDVYPDTTQISTSFIPLEDESVDVIFLLSAVHEIRSQAEKIVFLRECRRVCKPSGQVIMVEHLRDLPNFLAFSVGFTHFFSRKVWREAFTAAGFSSFSESKFTPFMSIFRCGT